MSTPSSRTALDAGASIATKNTDLTEGGKKQPYPVLRGNTGMDGGMLDNTGGHPANYLGNDSSDLGSSTFAAGASSAMKDTDLTDSVHEDAGRGIESMKGASAKNANQNQSPLAGASSGLGDLKDKASHLLGGGK